MDVITPEQQARRSNFFDNEKLTAWQAQDKREGMKRGLEKAEAEFGTFDWNPTDVEGQPHYQSHK